jgi:hypothetical protein
MQTCIHFLIRKAFQYPYLRKLLWFWEFQRESLKVLKGACSSLNTDMYISWFWEFQRESLKFLRARGSKARAREAGRAPYHDLRQRYDDDTTITMMTTILHHWHYGDAPGQNNSTVSVESLFLIECIYSKCLCHLGIW